MKRISIGLSWQFSDRESWVSQGAQPRTVDLPHDYIIGKPRDPASRGGASTGFYPGGYGEYKKAIPVPMEWKGGRVLLEIGGAYRNAEVWLDGTRLCLHAYGYTAFRVDLTDSLKYGGVSTLVIRTRSSQPDSRWYAGAGLYRDVSLLVGKADSIDPWKLYVRTLRADKSSAEIAVEYPGEALSAALWDGDRLIASGRGALTVEHPRLWSPDDPHLYTLRLANTAGDSHEMPIGIRIIEMDARRGMRINGTPIKLKGGCIHHDNGPLGACSFPAAEERKARLLASAGYNAVRIAHNPASEALLSACDRAGLLVMNEAFDCWLEGKNTEDYHLYFEDNWEADIDSMVLSSRNHACVFSYSIGNEIAERDGHNHGAEWARKLAARVRLNDPHRPVTSALNNLHDPALPPRARVNPLDNLSLNLVRTVDFENDYWARTTSPVTEALDIVGYNYLVLRYAHDQAAFPDRLICGTETFPYFTYDYWRETEARDNVIGDFIWTAFDYLGEAGIGRVVRPGDPLGFLGRWPWEHAWCGDFDICGRLRPQGHYREILWGKKDKVALFTEHPRYFGIPAGGSAWQWHDVSRTWTFTPEWIGKSVHVEAYCDADEVAFLLDGEELARCPVSRLTAEGTLPYRPGRLAAVAYRNGIEIGRDEIATAGPAVRIELLPDRSEIAADGTDLCYVTCRLLDAEGNPAVGCERELSAFVSGAATLAAVGTGNPADGGVRGDRRVTAGGEMLAILRAGAEAGEAALTVLSSGIPAATVSIRVKGVRHG